MYGKFRFKFNEKAKPANDKEVQEWLKKNAISCAIGKVSKEQCIENRKRPLMNEKVSRFYLLRYSQGEVLYMPKECRECTEWKKFFTKEEILQQLIEIGEFRKKNFTKTNINELVNDIEKGDVDKLLNDISESDNKTDIKETKKEKIKEVKMDKIKEKVEKEKQQVKEKSKPKETEKKKVKCDICGEYKVHHGRGLCSTCYGKLKRKDLLDKYTDMQLSVNDLKNIGFKKVNEENPKLLDNFEFNKIYADCNISEGDFIYIIEKDGILKAVPLDVNLIGIATKSYKKGDEVITVELVDKTNEVSRTSKIYNLFKSLLKLVLIK